MVVLFPREVVGTVGPLVTVLPVVLPVAESYALAMALPA